MGSAGPVGVRVHSVSPGGGRGDVREPEKKSLSVPTRLLGRRLFGIHEGSST